jgi:hypothetical protein
VVGVLAPTGSVIDRLVSPRDRVWHEHGSHPTARPEITALLIRYATPLAAAMLPRAVNATTAMQAASPPTCACSTWWGRRETLMVRPSHERRPVAFVALTSALQERRYDLALLRTLGARPVTLALLTLAEGVTLLVAGVIRAAFGHGARTRWATGSRSSGSWPLAGSRGHQARTIAGGAVSPAASHLSRARAAGVFPRSREPPRETIGPRTMSKPRLPLLAAAAMLVVGSAVSAPPPQDPKQAPASRGFWIGPTRHRRHRAVAVLQSTKTVQKADKVRPVLPERSERPRQEQVKLYGFMMPLDQAEEAEAVPARGLPPHCSFCLPAGAESLVEVIADKPIDFTFEPIVVAGRMAILDDDVVYYRLTGASSVKP